MKTGEMTVAGAIVALSAACALADPLGTAFTYQESSLTAACRPRDLRFSICCVPFGPEAIAGPMSITAVGVSDGLFLPLGLTVPYARGVGSDAGYPPDGPLGAADEFCGQLDAPGKALHAIAHLPQCLASCTCARCNTRSSTFLQDVPLSTVLTVRTETVPALGGSAWTTGCRVFT